MTAGGHVGAGWAIMRGIWLQQWKKGLALCAVVLAFGVLSWATASLASWHEILTGLGYFAMSLSLGISFILSGFTEADRKNRSSGFPIRLFTLPASTSMLVLVPMLGGILLACLVYALWATIGMPGQGLSLTWPFLYLAVAMICYQTIVWSLARHRVVRIVVLGYVGAMLAMGWVAFRGESDFASELSLGLSEQARRALSWMLAGIGSVLFWVARAVVERQRCGERGFAARRKRRQTLVSDTILSRPRKPFRSAKDAQFWLEWRRHGTLLPLATCGVLLVIMAPAPFVAPVSAGMTVIALGWIVATPPLIAFVLGKGLGKADLWASDPAMPQFFAVRPLDHAGRIGAKLKMAGAAALVAWALVVATTSLWLWLWCDRHLLTLGWVELRRSYSSAELALLAVTGMMSLIVLTFRFLAGSLYIGLSGRRWLVNAAACWVFAAIFGALSIMLVWQQNPSLLAGVLPIRPWGPWLMGGLFAGKAIAAFVLATRAKRCGWITASAIRAYFAFWSVMTAGLTVPAWLLGPEDRNARCVLVLLGFFAVPLFRITLAPFALQKVNEARDQ